MGVLQHRSCQPGRRTDRVVSSIALQGQVSTAAGDNKRAAAAMAQSFAALRPELSQATLTCLQKDFRFDVMTPVQAASLPLLLTQKDVVAEAVTGIGQDDSLRRRGGRGLLAFRKGTYPSGVREPHSGARGSNLPSLRHFM